MDAYDRAIRQLIEPGDRVLDLGAGTGILGLLAARRQARVHAIESTDVAALIGRLAAANGLGDLVTVHHADVRTLEPVETVDWIVSDFMGRFVVDDGMLDAVAASASWAGPATRYIPNEVRLIWAPVGNLYLWSVDFFDHPLLGIDLSPLAHYADNHIYVGQLRANALAAEPVTFATIQPPRVPSDFSSRREFVVEDAMRVRALAGWFEADLAPENTLITGPGFESHWGQMLFPIPAFDAQPGDRLEVELRLGYRGSDRVWTWTGEWHGEHGRGQRFERCSRTDLAL